MRHCYFADDSCEHPCDNYILCAPSAHWNRHQNSNAVRTTGFSKSFQYHRNNNAVTEKRKARRSWWSPFPEDMISRGCFQGEDHLKWQPLISISLAVHSGFAIASGSKQHGPKACNEVYNEVYSQASGRTEDKGSHMDSKEAKGGE